MTDTTEQSQSMALLIDIPPALLTELKAQIKAELLAEMTVTHRIAFDRWIGVEEAAVYLSCSTDRIYALCSQGQIPVHKDGSRSVFKITELDQWVRSGGGKRQGGTR